MSVDAVIVNPEDIAALNESPSEKEGKLARATNTRGVKPSPQ